MPTSLVSTGVQFPDSTIQTTAATGSVTKTWTYYTSSSTYTVPSGVTSVRIYAFGKGGDGSHYLAYSANYGGSGGGCAFGNLAVTAGQTITITISAGVATVIYGGVTRLTANPGTDGTTYTQVGGTASIGTGITSGGAYTGGLGQSGAGGGSSASPLGNGYPGYGGGGGWGGAGTPNSTYGAGSGGGVGGTGGYTPSLGSGSGGGAGGSGAEGRSGSARNPITQAWTDPLLIALDCYGPGGVGSATDSRSSNLAQSGYNGGGGGGAAPGSINTSSGTANGGYGGAGGGGGAANAGGSGNGVGGVGGFGGGGGSGIGTGYGYGGSGGYGGGGGWGGNSSAYATTGGLGGAAIVLIYAPYP